MNYNRVIIAGNLTRDIELRFTPKGMAIAVGSVAINRKTRSEAGEQKDEVTFVEFTAFGKTAQTISECFFKGKPIFLEGRLRTESWTDKQSGQNRSKLSVIVDSFQFVGGKEPQPDADPGPAPPPVQPQAAQPNLPPPRATAGAAKGGRAGDKHEDQDQIPF